jgi:hypothetical protein
MTVEMGGSSSELQADGWPSYDHWSRTTSHERKYENNEMSFYEQCESNLHIQDLLLYEESSGIKALLNKSLNYVGMKYFSRDRTNYKHYTVCVYSGGQSLQLLRY